MSIENQKKAYERISQAAGVATAFEQIHVTQTRVACAAASRRSMSRASPAARSGKSS